ncbi:MAG: hypothetical protein IT373_30980 [Polyangiaceae bacterium]|nr:hypothetical protein [Polyangiaceae bacterium]
MGSHARSPLGWHIGLRLADDRVLAGTPGERRLLSRAVLRHGERARLVAYRAADTHVHAELLCDHDEVGRFVRSVGRCLALELGRDAPLRASFVKPLADQRHGQSTLRYILGQEQRHGLDSDPFHEASNLPDLLGLRVVGRSTAQVLAQAFPRIRREELVAALGRVSSPEPLDLHVLADAAAAALALPDLCGHDGEAVAARHAAVHAAGRAILARHIAQVLGTTQRTVERLRTKPCDARLLEAVRGQWRLRCGRRADEPRALLAEDAWVPTE